MKTRFLSLLLIAVAPLSLPAHPEHAAKSAQAEAVGDDAALCVVSGEKLGEMGKPYAYTYKVEGQPDQTVMLCCKRCAKKFAANPGKYLKSAGTAAQAPGADAKPREK